MSITAACVVTDTQRSHKRASNRLIMNLFFVFPSSQSGARSLRRAPLGDSVVNFRYFFSGLAMVSRIDVSAMMFFIL